MKFDPLKKDFLQGPIQVHGATPCKASCTPSPPVCHCMGRALREHVECLYQAAQTITSAQLNRLRMQVEMGEIGSNDFGYS
jgi:hypothetical protein